MLVLTVHERAKKIRQRSENVYRHEEHNGLQVNLKKHCGGSRAERTILIASFYEMWRAGKSFEEIGALYGYTRKKVYGMLVSRGYEVQRRYKYIEIDGMRFAPHPPRGWYRQIGNGKDRKWLHRYLWEKANGPIPKSHHVQYRDGNPENNDLSNLVLTRPGRNFSYHERFGTSHKTDISRTREG